MSNVVDLTRRLDGKLNGISLKSVKIERKDAILPDYLQEVNLGTNIRACYFLDDSLNDKDFFYYDTLWMKIPKGFNYVGYTPQISGEIVLDAIVSSKALQVDILTPVLRFFDSDVVSDDAHICHGMREGNQNGCSEFLTSSKSSADLSALSNNSTPNKPFYMFNFNGELRMTILKKGATSDEDVEVVIKEEGDYYLFPLVLSDRTVVYYAVKGRDEEVFKIIYEASISNKYAEIALPLTMNDKLGIFVTSNVIWVDCRP